MVAASLCMIAATGWIVEKVNRRKASRISAASPPVANIVGGIPQAASTRCPASSASLINSAGGSAPKRRCFQSAGGAPADGKIQDFLDRPLEGDWPYLWLDGTYVKVREAGRIVSVALIGTARLNDADPQAWLADTLARIAATPQTRLEELLPWNWDPARQHDLAA